MNMRPPAPKAGMLPLHHIPIQNLWNVTFQGYECTNCPCDNVAIVPTHISSRASHGQLCYINPMFKSIALSTIGRCIHMFRVIKKIIVYLNINNIDVYNHKINQVTPSLDSFDTCALTSGVSIKMTRILFALSYQCGMVSHDASPVSDI